MAYGVWKPVCFNVTQYKKLSYMMASESVLQEAFKRIPFVKFSCSRTPLRSVQCTEIVFTPCFSSALIEMCPTRNGMKLNLHWSEGQNFHELNLNKVTTVKPAWLNPGGFKRKGSEAQNQTDRQTDRHPTHTPTHAQSEGERDRKRIDPDRQRGGVLSVFYHEKLP